MSTIKKRIISKGRGWCFTNKHFLDLGSDTGIRRALSRLQQEKMIRRLAPGLYEYPRFHEQLGELPPQVDQIAKAIAEKNGLKIIPSGAYAANLVGLSEQVPGRIVFLSNAQTKKLKIGKLEIIFREASEKSLKATGKVGLVINALRNIGKKHVDDAIKSHVHNFLKDVDEAEIKKNIKYAPQWTRNVILETMEK